MRFAFTDQYSDSTVVQSGLTKLVSVLKKENHKSSIALLF